MTFWCDQHVIVRIEGPGGDAEVSLPQPYARIGSHPESDVVLDDPEVAKRALYLHATQEAVYCLNLDVPEASSESPGRWLAADEVLTVGPYRLHVRLSSGSAQLPAQLPGLMERGTAGIPLPVLNVFCDRLLKDKRRLRARLNLLGRRPQCSLRLRGHEVSAFHCALYWHDRRLWCIDLNASNPTLINGEPFDCREVELHDQLDVGEFRLVYWRWSPRNWSGGGNPDTCLLPAGESNIIISGSGQFDAAAGAATLLAAGADDSDVIAGSSAPASGVLEAAHQEVARLAGEVASLTQQRDEQQIAWNETAAQLGEQLERLQHELVRRTEEADLLARRHEEQGKEWTAASQQSRMQTQQLQDELTRRTAEVARLAEERETEQAHWHETSQQMLAQNRQMQEELARLAEVHQALLDERGEWHLLRDQLQQQLAEQSGELARLKAELADAIATSANSPRQDYAVRPANGNAASTILVESESPSESRRVAAASASQDPWRTEAITAEWLPIAAAADDAARLESPEGASPEDLAPDGLDSLLTAEAMAAEPVEFDASLDTETPLDLPSIAQQQPEPPQPAELSHTTDIEVRGSAPGEGWLVDEKPVARGGASREGLSTFISDRLVDMQRRQRRRKQMLIWGAAIAVVGTSVAGALVAWQTLG